jgi:hypothetical protein
MTEHSPDPSPRSDPGEAELVEFIRSVDVRAPAKLHRRLQEMIDERIPGSEHRRDALPDDPRRTDGARRRGWRLGGALAMPRLRWQFGGALAVLAAGLALLLGLPGGGSTPFSLRQASALTLGPAKFAAPMEDPRHPDRLARNVDGVAFPYWEDSIGWRSTGARVDRLDGRSVTTVFYTDRHGQRVGYAIIAGSPAPRVGGGKLIWRRGVAYRLTSGDGAQVIAWDRDGHLCVIAGRGVSGSALLRLASDDGR